MTGVEPEKWATTSHVPEFRVDGRIEMAEALVMFDQFPSVVSTNNPYPLGWRASPCGTPMDRTVPDWQGSVNHQNRASQARCGPGVDIGAGSV